MLMQRKTRWARVGLPHDGSPTHWGLTAKHQAEDEPYPHGREHGFSWVFFHIGLRFREEFLGFQLRVFPGHIGHFRETLGLNLGLNERSFRAGLTRASAEGIGLRHGFVTVELVMEWNEIAVAAAGRCHS